MKGPVFEANFESLTIEWVDCAGVSVNLARLLMDAFVGT